MCIRDRLFGFDLSRLLNASNLAGLGEKFTEAEGFVAKFKANCDSLPDRLQLVLQNLGVSEDDTAKCDRVKTAKAARDLFNSIDGKEPTEMVKAIAAARIETTGKNMATSIKSAASVLDSLLEPNRWGIFEGVAKITDKRKTDAELLLDDLRTSLMMDEFALSGGLPAKLSDAEGRAVKLLTQASPVPPVVPDVDRPVDTPKPTPPGWSRVDEGSLECMSVDELTELTKKLNDELSANPNRRVTVQWTIEEQDS